MKLRTHSSWLAIAVVAYAPAAWSQETAPPPADTLPDVEVQQQQAPAAQPKPKPKPAAAKPKPQQQAAPAPQPAEPAPQPPQFDEPIAEISEPAQILANSPYGASGATGAARRAQFGNLPPADPTQALPDDLQNVTSGATRVGGSEIVEQRPITNHDALARVPGVVTVNDDGLGRHGGIGIRGAPPRRSRKVLVMEDGLPLNY